MLLKARVVKPMLPPLNKRNLLKGLFMKRLLFVSASIVALALGLQAQASSLVDKGESSIKVTEGQNETLKIEKAETLFFEDFYSDYNRPILFKVITHTNYNTAMEGSTVSSVVTAYSTSRMNFGQPLWVSSVKGGSFSVLSADFVSTVVGGCCGAPNENQLIRKEDGQVVAVTHDDSTYIIAIPNSSLPLRYLGKTYEDNIAREKNGKSYIATILYFSKKGIISRARVYADLPEGWGADIYDIKINGESLELQGNTVTLWGKDGSTNPAQAFSDFGISGTLSYANQEESFELNISEDKISSTLSKKSSGLSLEIL